MQRLPEPTALTRSSRTCSTCSTHVRRYFLLWFLSSSVDLPHLPLPMQHLCKLLRNAADVHSTPPCLGSCKTRSSWLQTRGHLYDTPDSERVMVWTVYEMASFGREFGTTGPFLGCESDALDGAYFGDASRTRVESGFLFQAILHCHRIR